jgi:hypothetical protein
LAHKVLFGGDLVLTEECRDKERDRQQANKQSKQTNKQTNKKMIYEMSESKTDESRTLKVLMVFLSQSLPVAFSLMAYMSPKRKRKRVGRLKICKTISNH